LTALLVVLAGLIPAMIILNMRNGFSTAPRFHVFFDMDFQPKKKAQQTTTIFADGRTMRPQVDGTVARGQLDEQDSFYLGYDPSKLSAISNTDGVRLVAAQTDPKPQDATKNGGVVPTPSAAAPAVAAPAPVLNLPWINTLPIEANEENMKLGETKFQTYCSACHGYAGYGDGLVHKRAEALAQGYWIPPTSMHIDRVTSQPVGQIFHTITKGQGKMPGYAASMNAKERWAVVLYVKALQRSRNASDKDVPNDKISSIEDLTQAKTDAKK
jgi:mono/diheme cytochrome c family protein